MRDPVAAALGLDEGPRRARQPDLPGLARMLARAFIDDPVARWSCRQDRLRPAALERVFTVRLRQLFEHGEIWTSEGLASTAVWAPPGRWKTTAGEDIALAWALARDPRLTLRAPLVMSGLLGIEATHPDEPLHWYLAILGTDPPSQGHGLASEMMRPVLQECDRDGVGAYLESSNERNVDFYMRHGFRTVQEKRLPRGPRVWLMWRDPRLR
jgi:ribosomal protein S18 acetylase RimI-like enzyme